MTRQLHVLAPTRYPWRFNGPRHSRHRVEIRKFLPMNRFSYKLEGFTLFNPWPPDRFDLIHSFNRIPIEPVPFVIGFESHLPRAYGLEHTGYYRWLSKRLAGTRCRRIIAMSEYARRQFERQHQDRPWTQDLMSKLCVRYPNLDIPSEPDVCVDTNGPIRLVYSGHHFGRKGGAVVVRMAELALQRGIDLSIDLISSCEVGIMSWVDPLRTGFFAADMEKLGKLSNLRHHASLPNPELMTLVSRSHFIVLPTFADTFGYAVIEAMARYTPAITTTQGALTEFIRDGENGILLPLDCDEHGDWIHMKRTDRETTAYEQMFRDETNRLAESALERITAIMNQPRAYAALRRECRLTAERLFDAQAASHYWDELYTEACT